LRFSSGLKASTLISLLTLLAAAPSLLHAQESPAAVQLPVQANAVVRVESTGSFRPLFVDEDELSGTVGSGFLISSDGLLVTNAHVVNGGITYAVFLPGSDEQLDARLVGVNECADLAVLDIEGEGFPTLAWSDAPARLGSLVTAVGYPDGVEEPVATTGRIRSLASDAATDFASVSDEMLHSARTAPGSSGGPLLVEDGSVVGVVYARGDLSRDGAAIAADDARNTIGKLLQGDNPTSIGVNALAFDEGTNQYGVWIVSIAPGSAAEKAGFLPGDIIRELDGIEVGRDGTLEAYCAVLQGYDGSSALSAEIIRTDSSERLSGAINGTALRRVDTVRAAPFPTPTPVPTPLAPTLVAVADASSLISINAPSTWAAFESRSLGLGSMVFGRTFAIAPDARSLERGTEILSAAVVQASDLEPTQILGHVSDEIPCTSLTRTNFSSEDWSGPMDQCEGMRDPSYLNAALRWNSDPSIVANISFFSNSTGFPITMDEIIAPLSESIRANGPVKDSPRATVQVDALNVRTGPGLEFTPTNQVYFGEELIIAGKDAPGCEWVYVAFSNLQGWVAAAPQYLALDRDCSELSTLTEFDVAAWQAE
jgi:serine protease Do